jgi:hypothetical protein
MDEMVEEKTESHKKSHKKHHHKKHHKKHHKDASLIMSNPEKNEFADKDVIPDPNEQKIHLAEDEQDVEDLV